MATEHTVHCGASRSESVDSNDHPLSLEEYFKIGSIGGPSEGEVGPKRRGPKPDLTPAKNEKVERNRKAQRSHRERKERYICNLEQEVQRLRGAYTAAVKEKMTVVEENRQLHALLKQRGINFSLTEQGATVQAGNNHSHHTHQYQPQPQPQPQLQLQPQAQPQPITAEQYSRIAINLVLALEKLCLDHIQKLSSLSTHNRDYIQGHVLMVSCPPATHTLSHPDEEWGLRTVDLDPEPLNTLLNMQVLDAQRQRYLDDLDGELTPMAAWTKTTIHPRFHELTLQDFDTLMQILPGKVGCHGFGAVIEEAEVEDALEFIFAKKDGRA